MTSFCYIASEDLAEELVIRCRGLQENDKAAEDEDEDGEVPEDVFLKQLEASMLSNITLGGVEGIQRAFIVEHKRNQINENGEFEQLSEWVVETDGINLKKVLTIDGIDPIRTTSNNCAKVLEVLGNEAARQSLLRGAPENGKEEMHCPIAAPYHSGPAQQPEDSTTSRPNSRLPLRLAAESLTNLALAVEDFAKDAEPSRSSLP